MSKGRKARFKTKIDNIHLSFDTAERIRAALDFHGMSLNEFIFDAFQGELRWLETLKENYIKVNREEREAKLAARDAEMERQLKEMFGKNGCDPYNDLDDLDELDKLFTPKPDDSTPQDPQGGEK